MVSLTLASPSGILFSLLLSSIVCSSVHATQTKDQHETSKYTKGSTHTIRKRSIFTNDENRNTFPQSMASVCSIASSKIEIKTNKTYTVMVQHDEDMEYYSSYWPLPAVFPIKIRTSRTRKGLEVKLEVNHTSKALLTRIHLFQRQEFTLDSEKGYAVPATSTVELVEDRSVCNQHRLYHHNPQYIFSLASNNSEYVIRASVDLCLFGWYYNRDKKYSFLYDNKWSTDLSTNNYRHPRPRFKVTPDPGRIIFITKGKNISIDVDVDFEKSFNFTVRVLLWDWKENRYVTDEVRLAQPISEENFDEINNQTLYKERVLKIELVGISFIKSMGKNKYGWKKPVNDTVAKIRITVTIGDRDMSGKLILGYHWSESRWSVRPFIRHLTTERVISLKLINKIFIFPRDSIEVEGAELECDDNGNRGRKRYGKTCVVECKAYGPAISSILIIKSRPFALPIKSTSYIIQGTAYALNDVGPASEENAGRYQCVAFTEEGQLAVTDIHLYTSGFTKINNLTVEELGNSTTRIVCSASGDQPLNFSITVSDDRGRLSERLDTVVGNLPMIEKSPENETNFILLLCSDQFQYPRRKIVCEATGQRGSDSKTIYVPYSSNQSCDPYTPRLIRENSSISIAYGKIRVICEAYGKDIRLMVSYGSRGEHYRIDKNGENLKYVLDTDDWEGRILTVEIPIRHVKRPWTTLHCGVKNKYGSHWLDFDVDDILT